MLNLEYQELDGKKVVILDERVYSFVEELRGVREKFWLVQSKGKFVKERLFEMRV